ncbi:MAG: hypothetical protein E7665_02260 [Ruminococcaceae bacterium]|nr:hypothetical protein [Oscillospiraceae bacterium]
MKNKKNKRAADAPSKKHAVNRTYLIRGAAFLCAALLVVTGVVIYNIFGTQPNEKRAVSELVKAINELDSDRIEEILDLSSIKTDEVFYWGLDDTAFEAYTYITEELPGTSMFLRYAASYVTHEIVKHGDSHADVRFRYLDLSKFVSSVYTVYQAYILTSSLEGTELLPRDQVIDGIIVKMINDGYHFEFVTKDVRVDFTKADEGMKIKYFDELAHVVYGGLFDDPEALMKEIADGFAAAGNSPSM